MLRSVHAFSSNHATSLSFANNALFVDLGNADDHWRFVMDAEANTGFVPKSYVQPDEQLSHQQVQQHVDGLRLKIRQKSTNNSASNKDQEKILERLEQVVNNVSPRSANSSASKTKRKAPLPPPTAKPSSSNCSKPNSSTSTLSKTDSSLSSSSSLSESSLLVHARDLCELIRVETGLSSWSSQSAVHSVVSYLVSHLRHADKELPVLATLLEQPLNAEREAAAGSRQLELLLESLCSHKEDEQQRNWQLAEDEMCIANLLENLLKAMNTLNEVSVQQVLAKHKYVYVQSLIEYFQMETRWRLRNLLIENMKTMCQFENVVGIMLNSVLPLELAQILQLEDNRNERAVKAAALMTHIFSSGETMPVQYLAPLGKDFVEHILNLLQTTENEELAEHLTTFLLSYNLQFELHREDAEKASNNVVIHCLSEGKSYKTFMERLLLLLNREEDPVAALCGNNTSKSPLSAKGSNLGDFERRHSSFKMAVDIFGDEKCSSLLYTNDLLVLIDIVVRQLTDLGPGDEERKLAYLRLCNLVLGACDYEEHCHRASDLARVFEAILDEEHDHQFGDQLRNCVNHIVDKFHKVFGALVSK